MIELSINGQKQRFETGTNIAQLIDAMALTGKRIAIERNGEIVPRSRHAETWLANGDRLEIVVAVGGG
jgi:sulfur carrier protein